MLNSGKKMHLVAEEHEGFPFDVMHSNTGMLSYE